MSSNTLSDTIRELFPHLGDEEILAILESESGHDLETTKVSTFTRAAKAIGAHLFWSINLRVDKGEIHSWLEVSMWVRRRLDENASPIRYERIGAKAVPLALRVVDCNKPGIETDIKTDAKVFYHKTPTLTVRDDHIHFDGNYALRVVMPSIYQIIPVFLQQLQKRAYQLGPDFKGTDIKLGDELREPPTIVPDPNLYPENISLRAAVDLYNRRDSSGDKVEEFGNVAEFEQKRSKLKLGLKPGILKPGDKIYPIWFMYQSTRAKSSLPLGDSFIKPPFAFFGEIETDANSISKNRLKERERKMYWEVNSDGAQSSFLSNEYHLSEYDEGLNPNPAVNYLKKNIRHLQVQQDGTSCSPVFEQWVDKIKVGEHQIRVPKFTFPLERTSFIIGGLPAMDGENRKLLGLHGKLYSFSFDPNESCTDCGI